MFNGVVNPFITSSQQHIFDHALSSFPPPHDHHHHQLLHVMADRSSSCCFNDYDGGPFDNTCCCNGRRSLFVQSSSSCKNNDGLIPIDHNNTSSALRRERSAADNSDYYYNIHHHDPWCSDEVFAPLKVIRSARKLAAEPGYKRGDEDMQWKKKYEEEEDEDEGKQLNQANPNSGKTVQVITKLNEQLLQQQHKIIINGGFVEETPNNDSDAKREVSEEVVDKEASKNKRKRGRQRRRREEDGTFESSLKRCCEAVMNKMIAHQEELHKKLMEDIIRRDEENIAREESWKNQEMAKMREATEMRAKEQVHAEKKQAVIVEFLKKFTSSCHDDDNGRDEECPVTDHESRHQFSAPQNPSSLSPTHQKNDDIVCSKRTTSEDSRTSSLEKSPEPEAPRNQEKGKNRWPRDEVLALINLRCKMMSNDNASGDDHIVGGKKGHLWERISRGMLEMGYERSAKRCKEKWENINKYFRRTRDSISKKKRSMDSRTCPYFHQLSCLYSEG